MKIFDFQTASFVSLAVAQDFAKAKPQANLFAINIRKRGGHISPIGEMVIYMPKRYLEIGKIVAVQGLKGEVRVEPWCDSGDFLCEFDTLYFDKGNTPLEIVRARVQKNIVIMKIKDIDTVEQAQNIRNKILYMDREDVELEEGAYFVQDLIGLSVIDADNGTCYGKLCEVSFTGANDVYHIKDEDGTVRLIPAIPDVVLETNITDGIMKIHVLEGLFDEN